MWGLWSAYELGAKSLTYPDGRVASCDSIGVRISEILREEEELYVAHIQSLPPLAHLDPAENGKHCLTPIMLFEQLSVAAKSLSPVNDVDFQGRTFLAYAPYFGYLTHRLYYYANLRSPGETELAIDRNDCEDAYILLNLDLFNDDTLVTNDKGTLQALRGTINLLNAILPVPLSQSCVMSGDEFLLHANS